ncbi:MAG: DUF308 domain-containing protein [Bacilli bacterium]|nr:DUF308 domain-containing protein [Bacilli bacterium]
MEVTVLKNKSSKSLASSILLLVLGIFLTFNSDGLLGIIFDIIGAIAIIYGIYQLIHYFSQKKEFNIDDGTSLLSGISAITMGLLIILLANFLTNAIKIVTGIWLVYLGISKLGTALTLKRTRAFKTSLLSAIILFLLGIYTLIAENVVFVTIGIILIIYSVFDIISYLKKNK